MDSIRDTKFDSKRRDTLKVIAGASALVAWPGFAFADAVANDVVFLRPVDKDYGDYVTLFNKCLVRRPALVAVCFNEKGVVEAVKRARKEGLPVAIKAGGHSFEGFSLNDNGFVIDVSNMLEHGLVEGDQYVAEPGCVLMQGYEYLVPKGRLLSMGSCGMVGIAGLTLGGGYGIFSRQNGLTCDALQSLRMVDGNGEVHDVARGSELFRACCGGGNGSFGVVTKLRFDTLPAPKSLWRHLFKFYKLDAKRAEACAGLWFELAPKMPDSVFSAFVLNNRTLTIMLSDTAEEISDELSIVLEKLAEVADKRYPSKKEALLDGIHRYYGRHEPLYFKNASAGYYRGFQEIEKAAPALFDLVTSTPGLLYQINTMGGAIPRMDDGTYTSYAHRDANFLSEIQSYWEDPKEEKRLRDSVARFQSLLRTNGIRAHYCNYPDLSFTDWQESYYGKEGYRRLQQVKWQYDPDNLFQHAQSIRL